MCSSMDGGDFINHMPDEILHHILSFLPINRAIRTSVLSRRWRHVWCETPCIKFPYFLKTTAQKINQTLSSYRAPKIMSLHLYTTLCNCVHVCDIDRWVEFAVSRNVENLYLSFGAPDTYRIPDCFYLSSSLRQLCVYGNMIPRCTVSWKSLRQLTLGFCYLHDESVANILSGCPILETLNLFMFCGLLKPLDLSKSPSLRTLEIDRDFATDTRSGHRGPIEIVAPHIKCLILTSSEAPCTLVDVSSLTEAKFDIYINDLDFPLNADLLQITVLKMLAKFQNVERLTLGGRFLKILSLAELCGVPLPTLKVQTLIIETKFVRSVIPGIARLLQNSPGLKRLQALVTFGCEIENKHLDSYLNSQRLNPDQCWRPNYEVFPTSENFDRIMKYGSKENMWKILASFMEMLLRNGKTLEKLVVGLKDIIHYHDAKLFEELLQMPPTLSNNNNVAIVLKR